MSIRPGDTVSVHYIGTLSDGTEFDRSPADSPLVFRLGAGQLVPGFEQAVEGRERGDAFTVTIPADLAYGPYDEELLFQVPIEQVPPNIEPRVGMMLHVATDQGELEVVVADVDDRAVTLDANHPLAGKELTFAITIMDVC